MEGSSLPLHEGAESVGTTLVVVRLRLYRRIACVSFFSLKAKRTESAFGEILSLQQDLKNQLTFKKLLIKFREISIRSSYDENENNQAFERDTPSHLPQGDDLSSTSF